METQVMSSTTNTFKSATGSSSSESVTAVVRLTPTGKISHAKTRVYTQRYRKEWEQMSDFQGWLTCVPLQPTRAFCLYCKKNLHAHRLSLLKHTCTMKHQRAALMHQAEQEKNESKKIKVENAVDGQEVEIDHDYVDDISLASDENEDDIEYVVERLEMDDEEMESIDAKMREDIEEVEVDEDNNSPKKKITLDTRDGRDTLAEAMAHVHGEYLDEEQSNVQIEMVVESEEQSNSALQDIADINDSEDRDSIDINISTESNNSIKQKSDKQNSIASTSEELKSQNDSSIFVTSLPILGSTFQLNSSISPSTSTVGLLQQINTIPISQTQNKTITLNAGGKTLTLTGGTFAPSGQYVLSKLKGKLPTLLMSEKKIDTNENANQSKDIKKVLSPARANSVQNEHASTIQVTPKKSILTKPVKSNIKKPRISTAVTDTSKGVPVSGLQVCLYKLMDGRWTFLNESYTNPNGRCSDLIDNTKINFTAGRYKLHFDVDKYYSLRKIETIFPFVELVFDVKNPNTSFHIPLLMSPYGYSIYRGTDR